MNCELIKIKCYDKEGNETGFYNFYLKIESGKLVHIAPTKNFEGKSNYSILNLLAKEVEHKKYGNR
jgi:hypothetical protein